MYESSDPRAALSATEKGMHAYTPLDASIVEFSTQMVEASAASSDWYARSQNLAIAYSEVRRGARLCRPASQSTEYIAIAFDCGITIETADGVVTAPAQSLVVVPPGASTLTGGGPGRILRLFTSSTRDVAEKAINAAQFASFSAPQTTGESTVHHVEVHALDVPPAEGRFGRIYSSPNIMVNVMYPTEGARDTEQLSPHSHPEFEQCSITIDGAFVHHLRWPWNNRLADWRDDAHRTVLSPSVTVIPSNVIHTTRAVGDGTHLLIDAFSPPRRDFAAMPGWVLNTESHP